eukprot:TRINITY_DN16548_c0_g1_i1.p1 TRINITY_DN16548_c0_g1~~TRINITY_DN16548_c0_g1_i1.p1  ORF type:complete len:332 (-),score=48.18 TRINITY_DN16548_c0_g1_i1:20-1015(-)
MTEEERASPQGSSPPGPSSNDQPSSSPSLLSPSPSPSPSPIPPLPPSLPSPSPAATLPPDPPAPTAPPGSSFSDLQRFLNEWYATRRVASRPKPRPSRRYASLSRSKTPTDRITQKPAEAPLAPPPPPLGIPRQPRHMTQTQPPLVTAPPPLPPPPPPTVTPSLPLYLRLRAARASRRPTNNVNNINTDNNNIRRSLPHALRLSSPPVDYQLPVLHPMTVPDADYMNGLPMTLWAVVLSYLSPQDLARLCTVSVRWGVLANSDPYWHNHYIRLFERWVPKKWFSKQPTFNSNHEGTYFSWKRRLKMEYLLIVQSGTDTLPSVSYSPCKERP